MPLLGSLVSYVTMRRNSEPSNSISDLCLGDSPVTASRRSYLYKRRSAYRLSTSRRSEIFGILDATLGCLDDDQQEDSQQSPLASSENEHSSHLSTNDKHLEVAYEVATEEEYSADKSPVLDDDLQEPLWYENDSVLSDQDSITHNEESTPFETEDDASTVELEIVEDDYDEESTVEEDDAIGFTNGLEVIFENDEGDSSLEDKGNDVLDENMLEEEVIWDEEEEIFYESEYESVEFIEEIVEEYVDFDLQDEGEGAFYDLEHHHIADGYETVIDEDVITGEDGSEPDGTDRMSFMTARQSLEEAALTARLSFMTAYEQPPEIDEFDASGIVHGHIDSSFCTDCITEETILVDDETDASQVSAASVLAECQDTCQADFPEDSFHSSEQWASAYETMEAEDSESSMEELAEPEAPVGSSRFHSLELKEAIDNEISEVSLEDVWGEESETSINVIENAEEVLEPQSPTCSMDQSNDEELGDFDESYFQNDSLSVVYKQDVRYYFPVPQVPALQSWESEAQLEVINQQETEAPEVAPRTPKHILMAILSQGDLHFKLRKVPKEHKKEYKSIAQMASSLGRLTKLQEHVVESISTVDVTPEVEEWTPRKSPLSITRSPSQRLSVEAAALGKTMRLKEEYFTNWEEDEHREEICSSIDETRDHRGLLMPRLSLLIHHHVRDSKIAKMEKDWAMEEFLEEEEEDQEFCLPTKPNRPPKFQVRKPEKRLSREEIAETLAQGVAEKWWERRYRLERPGAELRVHSGCNCLYCNASQTSSHAGVEERTPPSPLQSFNNRKVALHSNFSFNGFD